MIRDGTNSTASFFIRIDSGMPYPVILDSGQSLFIFGEERQFASAAEILSVVQPRIVDLEARLAASEATLK